jgi:hypothetical protein
MAGILRYWPGRWHVKNVVLIIWWLIYFLGIGIATEWGPGFTENELRLLAQALLLMAIFIFFIRFIAASFLGLKREERGLRRGLDDGSNMLWHMRWLVLIILSIGFLASTVGGMMSVLIMKNPLPLAIPPTLILLKRPVINYLFPTVQR